MIARITLTTATAVAKRVQETQQLIKGTVSRKQVGRTVHTTAIVVLLEQPESHQSGEESPAMGDT